MRMNTATQLGNMRVTMNSVTQLSMTINLILSLIVVMPIQFPID